jgi:hypothetical protein
MKFSGIDEKDDLRSMEFNTLEPSIKRLLRRRNKLINDSTFPRNLINSQRSRRSENKPNSSFRNQTSPKAQLDSRRCERLVEDTTIP